MRRISVAEAAAAMGKNPQTLRVMMQIDSRGDSAVRLVPFGTATQLPGSKRWNYYISPVEFERYVGRLDEVGA